MPVVIFKKEVCMETCFTCGQCADSGDAMEFDTPDGKKGIHYRHFAPPPKEIREPPKKPLHRAD